MNTATTESPKSQTGAPIATAAPSPDVAAAFADLDAARAELRRADDDCRRERLSLRRFARARNVGLREARRILRQEQPAEASALNRAELTAWKVQRHFQAVAMLAALTKVCDTDRRIKAGQPLAA